MSETESESISERELAAYLSESVFGQGPRSPSEAVAQEPPEVTEPVEGEPDETVVVDEPEQPEPEEPKEKTEAEPAPEPAKTEEPEEGELEEEPEVEDQDVVWAKNRFGEDPDKWAKILRDQDRQMGVLAASKKQAEEYAQQAFEYAQAVEQQAAPTTAMPLSQQEEDWADQSVADPMGYARAAAYNNNIPLFNAVIERIGQEDIAAAATVRSQVVMEMQQVLAQQEQQQAPPPLDQALMGSFERLQLEPETAIAAITQQVEQLTEYHPYRLAILAGDDQARDLAVQALVDLAGAGTMNRRRIGDDARAERIKREGELRREAAGVVTGAPHAAPPPPQDAFLGEMEAEWRARGQWPDE